MARLRPSPSGSAFPWPHYLSKSGKVGYLLDPQPTESPSGALNAKVSGSNACVGPRAGVGPLKARPDWLAGAGDALRRGRGPQEQARQSLPASSQSRAVRQWKGRAA